MRLWFLDNFEVYFLTYIYTILALYKNYVYSKINIISETFIAKYVMTSGDKSITMLQTTVNCPN